MGARPKQRKQIADLVGIRENGHARHGEALLEALDLSGRQIQVVAGIHDEQKPLTFEQSQRGLIGAANRRDKTKIGAVQNGNEAFLKQATTSQDDGRDRLRSARPNGASLPRGRARRANGLRAGLMNTPRFQNKGCVRVILIQLAHLFASSFSLLNTLRSFPGELAETVPVSCVEWVVKGESRSATIPSPRRNYVLRQLNPR
ncbi:MAG: hypothetical protein JO094_07875 [Hyphomicrobiales bacterium]|nr:hypothetical protein [Hyphomicrobiales bacterium]